MSSSENRNGAESAASQLSEASAMASTASAPSAECPHCFGSGMEIVPGEGARRCRCQSPDNRDRLLRAARIPLRYERCTLANYNAGETVDESTGTYIRSSNSDSLWAAKIQAQQLIDSYLSLDGRGLLFVGPVGVGKTHLAVAILIELIKRYHVRGLFYQFGALLKEIRDSYNPVSQSSELNLLRPILDADVVVLDELGSQKATDWISDTLMYIINARYNEKRTTILTSNYGDTGNLDERIGILSNKRRQLEHLPNASSQQTELINEQKSIYEGNLEKRIGVPLRSRLYEMCKTVVIEGEDYRKRLGGQI